MQTNKLKKKKPKSLYCDRQAPEGRDHERKREYPACSAAQQLHADFVSPIVIRISHSQEHYLVNGILIIEGFSNV